MVKIAMEVFSQLPNTPVQERGLVYIYRTTYAYRTPEQLNLTLFNSNNSLGSVPAM